MRAVKKRLNSRSASTSSGLAIVDIVNRVSNSSTESMSGMHGQLVHFAVNADDLSVTRAFYEGVFGWRFEEYMPGFVRTHDAGGPIGAIQGRRDLLESPTNAPEVTFEVNDVDAFSVRAVKLGGRVLMP